MFQTAQVFVLMIDAVAAHGCEHPEGERRHLLVMVPAGSAEEATTGAMQALTDCHWSHGEVRDIERFAVDPDSLEDPILREAAGKAFAGDRSIVVFDEL